MRHGVRLALLLCLTVAPAPAEALFLATYTGEAFSVGLPFHQSSVTGVYSLSDSISGTVLFAGDPFACGSPACKADYLAYSFTDGHQTLTESNSSATFLIGGQLAMATITAPMGGISVTSDCICDGGEFAWLGASTFAAAPSQAVHPGHMPDWNFQVVPEPPTLLLVLVGIAGFALASASSRGRRASGRTARGRCSSPD